jgi:Rieske Fe-S protein
MLISEVVEISVLSNNKSFLKERGYDISKNKVFVKICDLTKYSRAIVIVKCDVCEQQKETTYYLYIKNANNGGFYVDTANNVIIAKTTSGMLIAVSSLCTHQAVTLEFQGNNNRFYCPGHGSNFSTAGTVLNGPAATALKPYKTSLSGSLLRIYE